MLFKRQLPFIRDIRAEYPKATPSADSLGEAEASDQHRYYLKGDLGGKPIRASEWIATQLAEAVGIAAPAVAVLRRLNGETVFGSRRLIGVADAVITRNYLQTPSASNAVPAVIGLCPLLSAIYAFDLFVFNDDRHLGNYLSLDDNGVRRFYAFDFSRALFWRWPWVDFPDPTDNTRVCGRVLRSLHGFDVGAAQAIIDRLRTLSRDTVDSLMFGMPADWLSETQRQEFLDWWDSSERTDRLDALSIGLANGSLL